MTVAMHWAAKYIGKPWAPGATGPDAYDCWGLIRAVFAEHFAIAVPEVVVGMPEAENIAAIKHAAATSGWRRADAPMQSDDVVLMRNPSGSRHVGVAISSNGRLHVLHSYGCINADGLPCGDVICSPANRLADNGFLDLEFWRYTSPTHA